MLKPSCAIQIAQDGSHKTISVHYYLLSLWRPIEDFMIERICYRHLQIEGSARKFIGKVCTYLRQGNPDPDHFQFFFTLQLVVIRDKKNPESIHN